MSSADFFSSELNKVNKLISDLNKQVKTDETRINQLLQEEKKENSFKKLEKGKANLFAKKNNTASDQIQILKNNIQKKHKEISSLKDHERKINEEKKKLEDKKAKTASSDSYKSETKNINSLLYFKSKGLSSKLSQLWKVFDNPAEEGIESFSDKKNIKEFNDYKKDGSLSNIDKNNDTKIKEKKETLYEKYKKTTDFIREEHDRLSKIKENELKKDSENNYRLEKSIITDNDEKLKDISRKNSFTGSVNKTT